MGKRFEHPSFRVGPPRPKQATPSQAKPRTPLPKKRSEPRLKDGGKVVAGQKLVPLVVDPAYILALRDDPCEFTRARASADDPVEAMHIGNPGKNLKNDSEALPARHSVHDATHKHGITSIIPYLENDPNLLLAILRAYARERYRMRAAPPTSTVAAHQGDK